MINVYIVCINFINDSFVNLNIISLNAIFDIIVNNSIISINLIFNSLIYFYIISIDFIFDIFINDSVIILDTFINCFVDCINNSCIIIFNFSVNFCINICIYVVSNISFDIANLVIDFCEFCINSVKLFIHFIFKISYSNINFCTYLTFKIFNSFAVAINLNSIFVNFFVNCSKVIKNSSYLCSQVSYISFIYINVSCIVVNFFIISNISNILIINNCLIYNTIFLTSFNRRFSFLFLLPPLLLILLLRPLLLVLLLPLLTLLLVLLLYINWLLFYRLTTLTWC